MISSKPPVVVIPETFTLSNSVCPSTSKSPLASMAPVKVDTPVGPIISLSVPPVSILTVFSAGNPIVVSGSPMCLTALAISMVLPLNVAIPATFK